MLSTFSLKQIKTELIKKNLCEKHHHQITQHRRHTTACFDFDYELFDKNDGKIYIKTTFNQHINMIKYLHEKLQFH